MVSAFNTTVGGDWSTAVKVRRAGGLSLSAWSMATTCTVKIWLWPAVGSCGTVTVVEAEVGAAKTSCSAPAPDGVICVQRYEAMPSSGSGAAGASGSRPAAVKVRAMPSDTVEPAAGPAVMATVGASASRSVSLTMSLPLALPPNRPPVGGVAVAVRRKKNSLVVRETVSAVAAAARVAVVEAALVVRMRKSLSALVRTPALLPSPSNCCHWYDSELVRSPAPRVMVVVAAAPRVTAVPSRAVKSAPRLTVGAGGLAGRVTRTVTICRLLVPNRVSVTVRRKNRLPGAVGTPVIYTASGLSEQPAGTGRAFCAVICAANAAHTPSSTGSLGATGENERLPVVRSQANDKSSVPPAALRVAAASMVAKSSTFSRTNAVRYDSETSGMPVSRTV